MHFSYEPPVLRTPVRCGNPAGLGRSSILALTFILVTRKSPDRKQEVSSRIKRKIHFLFAGRAPAGRRGPSVLPAGGRTAAEPSEEPSGRRGPHLVGEHGAGDVSVFHLAG